MKFCSECGGRLIEKECINYGISDGMVPYCPNCEEFKFPQFNSAVSTVIFNKDFSKIFLIQQYGHDRNILLAGYVNKGETLEHALIREIKEEVNMEIADFYFNASEYFEKSNSLISNFISVAKSEDFRLSAEVDFAKWYTLEEAKEVIYQNSLAQRFLNLAIEKVSAQAKGVSYR